MVIILNLNMTVDKTFYIPGFKKGFTYRLNPMVCVAGGKGVNVARAFSVFSNDYILMGFLCGFTGKLIREYIDRERLNNVMIYQDEGESRICISIVDENGITTDINEEGPIINENSKKDFIKAFSEVCGDNDIIVISGRTPIGIDREFYSKLFNIAKRKKAEVFVDLTSRVLIDCIKLGAKTVKINSHEFEEVAKLKKNKNNVYEFYHKNLRYGLENLIVTDGNREIIAVIRGNLYEIDPPSVSVLSSVGAGDSFFAGYIYSFLCGDDDIKALKRATAFSVSDVLSLGAGFVKKREIEMFMKMIDVRQINMEVL